MFANVRVQGYHHLLAQGAELGLLLLLLGAQVLDELYGLLEHHRLAHLDIGHCYYHHHCPVNTIGYLVTTRVGGLTMRNQLLQGVVAVLYGIPSLLLGSRVGFSSDNNK